MSSNKTNGVTSASKVRELAGIFQSSETSKTGPSSAAGQYEAKAARRAYAVGKTSIVIEDKDSKKIQSRAKPGTMVGALAQNYHQPYSTSISPKLPSSPSPAAYAPPLPSTPSPSARVTVRSTSTAAPPAVNGVSGYKRQPSTTVRISSWDESKAGEVQPTETVRERAARMNSQQDSAGPKSPPVTPGKVNTGFFQPSISPVPSSPAQDGDIKPKPEEENGYQEDEQSPYAHEDREDEDDGHNQEDDNGYREDDNVEQDSREEDESSYTAEDRDDREDREDDYPGHETHPEEYSTSAEEEREDARLEDEDGNDDDDREAEDGRGEEDDEDGQDGQDVQDDEDAKDDTEDRRSNYDEDDSNAPVDEDDE